MSFILFRFQQICVQQNGNGDDDDDAALLASHLTNNQANKRTSETEIDRTVKIN
jgi:hypothetical protein